ncbi:sugar ABC transporter substrate-binding protein [Amycolatopsis acidicola]|uniref:sugar ABC transporter substrate-binding protein n=1 Tax=Amycolatopsis acidicola TaxID=2596893 RepID=UPI001409AC61|nr:sugar ABC transporter substrate-binding protein [Amycolatopsis acidicola]
MPTLPRRSALSAALLLALTGCSTGLETRPDNTVQSGALQVGALMYARDLEFWQLVEAGMKQAANEAGVPLHVDVSDRKLQNESQLLDTMYARGDNVLLVAPYDSDASSAALRRARARGLTIVQYDERVDDQSFAYFVGVDQKVLGEAAGEAAQQYIDSQLGGHAKAALLTGETESHGPPRRESFLAKATGAEVVTTTEAVGSPEAGAQAFETVLQSHPETQLVFAWNGAALQGAAIAARRLRSPVKIVGVDMSRQLADLLGQRDSPVLAVADQDAYQVGYRTLQIGVALARAKPVSRDTAVAPVIYRAGDHAALDTFYRELDNR